MPIHFEDRQAKYPNRWTMKKSDGTSEVVTLIRNDEPTVEGTPINAETLNQLSDVAGADVARAEAEAAAQNAKDYSGKAKNAAEKAAQEAASRVVDPTLSVSGKAADAKAAGDAIDIERKRIDVLNEGGLNLKDEVIEKNVTNWLDEHPEATTTVQDGALTLEKFESKLSQLLLPRKTYTLEMFGGVSNNKLVDNSTALKKALTQANINGGCVLLGAGVYYFSSEINFVERLHSVEICGVNQAVSEKEGRGTCLCYTGSNNFLAFSRLWRCKIHDFSIECATATAIAITTNSYLTQIYNIAIKARTCIDIQGFAYTYIYHCQLNAAGDGSKCISIGDVDNSAITREYIYMHHCTLAAYVDEPESNHNCCCIYIPYGVIHATIEDCDIMSHGIGIAIYAHSSMRYITISRCDFVAYCAIDVQAYAITISQLAVRDCVANYSKYADEKSRVIQAATYDCAENQRIRMCVENLNTVYAAFGELTKNPLYDIEAVTPTAFASEYSDFKFNAPIKVNFHTKYYPHFEGISKKFEIFSPREVTIKRILSKCSYYDNVPSVFVTDPSGVVEKYTVENILNGELSITILLRETWSGTKHIGVFVPGGQYITS